MMTSTYPRHANSYSGHSSGSSGGSSTSSGSITRQIINTHHLKPRALRDIKTKKEALQALEVALKKRMDEFRELCLKEGELTGQLPVDYPLQQREPIPPIRRRARNLNNNNLSENISIVQPSSIIANKISQQQRLNNQHNNNSTIQHQQFLMPPTSISSFPSRPTSTNSTSSSISTSSSNTRSSNNYNYYNNSNNLHHHQNSSNSFNGNCNLMNPSRYNGTIVENRATINSIDHQNKQFPNQQVIMANRNYSESTLNDLDGMANVMINSSKPSMPPPPPPPLQIQTSTSLSSQQNNTNGTTTFQPYYEETKPFQMSDFYKYSSKHRQKLTQTKSMPLDRPVTLSSSNKTTRQLQEDVSNKNLLKLTTCDDQIQASVKLIEKSGQKLIEATAKAIAVNPALAEKLSNILPNHNSDRYHV